MTTTERLSMLAVRREGAAARPREPEGLAVGGGSWLAAREVSFWLVVVGRVGVVVGGSGGVPEVSGIGAGG